MPRDRIAVDHDGELHDEPVITTAEHIRARQDKSHMTEADAADIDGNTNTTTNTDAQPASRSPRGQGTPRQTRNRRTEQTRSRKTASGTERRERRRRGERERNARKRASQQNSTDTGAGQEEESGLSPEAVKQRAVQKIVRRLREKGVDQSVIEDNMDEIHARVERELGL